MRPAVSWLSWERLMDERSLEGGCQCGAVRYRVSGEPVMAALCHCTMCRRANAAPAVAWAMFQESQVAFLKDRPATYASSPGGAARLLPGLRHADQLHRRFHPGPDRHHHRQPRPARAARADPALLVLASSCPGSAVADDLPRFPEFPPVA